MLIEDRIYRLIRLLLYKEKGVKGTESHAAVRFKDAYKQLYLNDDTIEITPQSSAEV